MTRPTILDRDDVAVVPRDTGDAFANSSLPSGMVEAAMKGGDAFDSRG